MQKKLPIRMLTSLILSVMMFALPIGALWANSSSATPVYAKESPSENEEGNENDAADEAGDTKDNADAKTSDEDESAEPEKPAVCTCTEKCSQYDYDKDCTICSTNYKKCAYKVPSVKITINTPAGWYLSGMNAKVTFNVMDIADSGHFAIKSVKAKVGQNGSYQDVTEDMALEISENCTVYVLVTDANDKSYERSRTINCFDTTKPTLNAAVSKGLLAIQASDSDSGIKVVYVNGYEFKDVTNGTVNIRLSQFDAGYEYFTITAMDHAGNVSEVYKTKNPYYKDPNSDDDSNPAKQLPVSADPTKPTSATATVTDHTTTDSNGNTTSTSSSSSDNTTPESRKKAEFAQADAEEAVLSDDEKGEDMNRGKEFYTIEAASGKVFYLIIDRDGEEEMVHFLTDITENDLLNVTTDNSETLPKNSAALESQIPITESALPSNNTEYSDTYESPTPTEEPEEGEQPAEEEPEEESPEHVKSNPLVGYIIMAIFAAGVVGGAYYFKVVKKKQDGDFVEDEEDDDEEYESDETEFDEEEDFFGKTEEERPEPDIEDAADTIDED